ncbi:MAG: putative peptidoglycan binding domain protein [Acidobacteria bacterium]|nr:putative peptidoglycan binding domain protein [Acidobacteriota bacterium]
MRSIFSRKLVLALFVLSALLSMSLAVEAQETIPLGGGTTKTQTKRTTRRRRPVRRVRRTTTTQTPTPTSTYISVPVGTSLKVRLNESLSSKESRVGDRFTVTVLDPVKYNEATINGHVSSINKSGKVSGRTSMNLDFDRITMPDSRTGTLHGYVARVYGQDAGRADNEGGVESGSRTKQAVKRGGIGAAAGAIIGGIAGGGKGAAIGLLIGGAGGAGSLAVQGSKELKLENGTELLIKVTR